MRIVVFRRSRHDPYACSSIIAPFFQTQTFDVFKKNHYGKVQRRFFVLNSDSWENRRPTRSGSSVLSKRFLLLNIERIELLSVSFFTIFVDHDHSFTFITPEAINIVLEITSRLNSIRSIFFKSQRFEPPSSFSSSFSSPSLVVPSSPLPSLSPLQTPRSREAKRLSSSVLSRLQARSDEHILRLCLSHEQISKQLENFYENLPLIMKHLNASVRGIEHLNVPFDKNHPSHEIVSKIRQIMSRIRDALFDEFLGFLIESIFEPGIILHETELHSVLKQVIEISIQKIVLERTAEELFFFLSFNCSHGFDSQINIAYNLTRNYSLSTFDHVIGSKISLELLTPVIELLSSLHTPCSYLPFWFIDKLSDISRMIYSAASSVGITLLSADQFLPIFIFCLKESKLESPFAICDYIFSLSDSTLLKSENGYYATAFNSACLYLHALTQNNFK
ncbi:hypothetical protein RCL1_002711 [Eukaryota sp. TZLM3-RCL]